MYAEYNDDIAFTGRIALEDVRAKMLSKAECSLTEMKMMSEKDMSRGVIESIELHSVCLHPLLSMAWCKRHHWLLPCALQEASS